MPTTETSSTGRHRTDLYPIQISPTVFPAKLKINIHTQDPQPRRCPPSALRSASAPEVRVSRGCSTNYYFGPEVRGHCAPLNAVKLAGRLIWRTRRRRGPPRDYANAITSYKFEKRSIRSGDDMYRNVY
ncbi:hypothetical protein EVAR_64953_1 [Eumeta japonica]|uniref:Uncharacterized protein n=1 Tax=Eumeta variegata TaxID=151549 RepID=A0A4C1ZDU5_EUMVA|nr:hypothetical protein EVAR_64953_1 [Eumeta japonica]